MNMRHRFFVAVFAVFMILPLQAGERTIPVDFFLMIDKSLSMAEPGKFDSMHEWVHDQLLGQILIDGDWITVWQFYGKADHLMTIDVKTRCRSRKNHKKHRYDQTERKIYRHWRGHGHDKGRI